MEGSRRILTLFCAEKHQKLGTPGSRRRQGPLRGGMLWGQTWRRPSGQSLV